MGNCGSDEEGFSNSNIDSEAELEILKTKYGSMVFAPCPRCHSADDVAILVEVKANDRMPVYFRYFSMPGSRAVQGTGEIDKATKKPLLYYCRSCKDKYPG
eukprot:gnl/Hemi2/22117_TR7371_c0_g1_i1.p3 gnl/Hemi2/22117_TR7371_c0_g1~~gnl/Hemi2/22117_TR7371_c0_g1_i1.p3  ORF type:complete len:101 (-),score=28.36 gnl/Hemi2/22117_TR7371_c0_g1_i1:286-588(-)